MSNNIDVEKGMVQADVTSGEDSNSRAQPSPPPQKLQRASSTVVFPQKIVQPLPKSRKNTILSNDTSSPSQNRGSLRSRGEHPGHRHDQTDHDKMHTSSETDGWLSVFERYKKLDEVWTEDLNKYIDTLLVFSGLFSAVLTGFVVQIYSELRPDSAQLSTSILLDVSRQLHQLSLGQIAQESDVSPPSEQPTRSHVVATSLWFLSLILSLSVALFSILVKEWLREYMRWTNVYPLQHAIQLRQYRRKDLDAWYIEEIATFLSEGLGLGLILFFIGMGVLLPSVNHTVAWVSIALLGIVLLLVVVVTYLPIFVPSCPYRSSFASVFMIGLVYCLRTLHRGLIALSLGAVSVTRTYIAPEDINEQTATWARRWLSKLDNFLRNPLIARWKGNVWTKWDMILRFSSSPEATVLEEWRALSWLISHQNVPSDLVVQCFSDVPGPPPPTLINQGTTWLEEKKWLAAGEMGNVKLQFRHHCQVLLSLLKPSKGLPELTDVTDLQAFLSEKIWQTREDEQQHNPTFDIDKGLLYRFWTEVQHISPLARNTILQCISSLTIMISDRHLFFSNKIEFDFFTNLLGVHFMLVTNRDPNQAGTNLYDLHHNTLVTLLSTDLLNMNARKSNRLSSSGSNGKNNNYFSRLEFAADLLSFSGSQYFCGTSPWKLEDETILLSMSGAIRFVERQKSITATAISPTSGKGASPVEPPISTKAFWAMAIVVFDPGSEELLDPQEEYQYQLQVAQFIRAVHFVLNFEIAASMRWDEQDMDDRCNMLRFFVQNRINLADGFMPTLKRAHETGVLNIDVILSNGPVTSPDSNDWILEKDKYLELLSPTI